MRFRLPRWPSGLATGYHERHRPARHDPGFPLPGALLLPRARLPLHIFEPRYLQMLDDTLKTPSRLIGMIQTREMPNGHQGDKAAPKRLHAIGCAGRLTGFSETEDGRYMISLSGVSRFRVKEEVVGFAPIAAVRWTGHPSCAIWAAPRMTRNSTDPHS